MRISHKVPVVLTALVFQSASLMALEFEPGAGVGLEYTDNATLAPNGSLNALTSIAYVGARIEENTGPFNLSATTSLNQHHYSKNAFSDERYFNLSASAGWEMIKNRVDWQLKNFYSQSSVNATSSSTPNNLQDTNIFSFGPNIRLPLSGRQTLTLSPQYQRYYYEVLTTDNSQSSLSVNWSYRMNRTTDIGVNTAVREIDYDRQGVPDNTISQMHLVLSGKKARSDYSFNLGATNVDREGLSSVDGVTGNFNWSNKITAQSVLRFYLASDLTDSSSNTLRTAVDAGIGDASNVQISSDVMRDRVVTIGYTRKDASLTSGLSAEYRDLDYNQTLDDRKVKSINGHLNYPVTQSLSSGLYARYSHNDQIDTNRVDRQTTYGGKLTYRLSRKLRCLLDLQMHTKDSTLASQTYDDFRAYISLVYGYGQPQRASQAARTE